MAAAIALILLCFTTYTTQGPHAAAEDGPAVGSAAEDGKVELSRNGAPWTVWRIHIKIKTHINMNDTAKLNSASVINAIIYND